MHGLVIEAKGASVRVVGHTVPLGVSMQPLVLVAAAGAAPSMMEATIKADEYFNMALTPLFIPRPKVTNPE